MSKNLDGIVAKIRDVRAKKRPEVEENLQKIEKLLSALRATRGRADSVAARYPYLKEALRGISFDEAENALGKASKACEEALVRLRRDSINIGVAGKARQGKSQILQMLTGLGDEQIPTGAGGFCTASRSVVKNGDRQSATVFYLDEAKLLGSKVYPSYEPVGTTDVALGLSPRPSSIAAFLAVELPTVSESVASVEAFENWKKVQTLQKDLRAHPELVNRLGSAPESIDIRTVRKYLVKDKGEDDYQVVDHVEIVTPFEMDLPKGMTVYDLPGLEDPTPGIRETMLRSVSEDADIVLLLRMPNNTGDDWCAADLRTMNMLKEVYPADEVQPKDWIQLVINLDRRPSSCNENNVELMKDKAPSGFRPVVCDCGSKDAVRKMVDANIDALVKQAGRIDDLRIRHAHEAFSAAIGASRALSDALRNATGDLIAQESGFDFERHLIDFMGDLRGPLKRDLSSPFREMVGEILARHCKAAEEEFDRVYDENADAKDFPPELPVFSKPRIRSEFNAGYGPVGVVEKAVRNQREAVLKLLRDQLSKCCGELVSRYFDCVVEAGFNSNPTLNRFSSTSDADESSKERLEHFLSKIRANGPYASLEAAVEELLQFELSFDETILPAIYGISDLDDFNPELLPLTTNEDGLKEIKILIERCPSPEKRTVLLFNWLRQKSEIILSRIAPGADSNPFASISEHIANTMRANYDAFAFRFIWGDTCDNEWRHLADRNKSIFWKDEFDAASANSKLVQDWKSVLADLSAAL
ncbi:MAG: hypothetical protein IKF72_10005 [Kiritimatiellae bacterium]|nr:hypothetical protein [Kiritimatiellia bacterium]